MKKYSGFVVKFLGVSRPVSLPRVAANFYLMYDISRTLQNSWRVHTREYWDRRFNEYVERWSQVFLRYIFVACVGEARYRCTDNINDNVPMFVREIPRFWSCGKHHAKITRYSVQSRIVRKYGRRFEKIAFLVFESLSEVFQFNVWQSGYGGPRWAQVAKLGALFMSQKIPPAVFVDQVFDVVHNNGRLFDKALFYNGDPVFRGEGIMRDMLDYKEPLDPRWRFVPMVAWGDYLNSQAWYEIVGKYTSIDLELVGQYSRYYAGGIRYARIEEEG